MYLNFGETVIYCTTFITNRIFADNIEQYISVLFDTRHGVHIGSAITLCLLLLLLLVLTMENTVRYNWYGEFGKV